ncbi:MAG: hypothetical protein HY394_03545 [Candidatus Diapherotrites archaeon]|nr:hypothetical protein [Candidatus Diapherotrites archaeon]
MVKVIKRDGSREDFNELKLKKSLELAGATPKQAAEVSERIASKAGKKRGEIESAEIRKMVVREFKELNRRVSDRFLAYVRSIELMSTGQPDLFEELKSLVEGNASISIAGAGYKIVIERPDGFPWPAVLHKLLEKDRAVVYMQNGSMVIETLGRQ